MFWLELIYKYNNVTSENHYLFPSSRWWSQIKTAGSAIYANRHYLKLYRRNRRVDRLCSTTAPTIIGDVFVHPSATVHPSAVVSEAWWAGLGNIKFRPPCFHNFHCVLLTWVPQPIVMTTQYQHHVQHFISYTWNEYIFFYYFFKF